MSEMYDVLVFRREGRLWASASVAGPIAYHSVDDLYPADATVEGLTRALIQADQRAHQEMMLPWPERCRDTKGFWRAAGCKTWRIFMRDLTACSIARYPEETTVTYLAPNTKYARGLSAAVGFKEHYPADISYAELAPIVLRVFATFPPDMKVPVR